MPVLSLYTRSLLRCARPSLGRAMRRSAARAALALVVGSSTVCGSTEALLREVANREYQLGRVAFEAGDFATAEPHFRKAAKVAPTFPEPLYALGVLFSKMVRGRMRASTTLAPA